MSTTFCIFHPNLILALFTVHLQFFGNPQFLAKQVFAVVVLQGGPVLFRHVQAAVGQIFLLFGPVLFARDLDFVYPFAVPLDVKEGGVRGTRQLNLLVEGWENKL